MNDEHELLIHQCKTNVRTQKKPNYRQIGLIASFAVIIILVIILIVIVIFYVRLLNKKKTCPLPSSNSSFRGLYMHSAVASDAIPCASVSNNIISIKGGNAIDGAIAGLFCSCSVNFHSCGIAGGSFLLFYNNSFYCNLEDLKKLIIHSFAQIPLQDFQNACNTVLKICKLSIDVDGEPFEHLLIQKKVYAYDIREMAPKLASKDMFAENVSSTIGGKSIAVSGLVSGYYEIHKRFGRIDWKTLIEPTIDILENGFYVSKSMEEAIDFYFKNTNPPEFKELRDTLTNPITGKPKRAGDIIKIPKLANTMRILSVEPYAMKNGSLVNDMIAEITSEGGIISKYDFSAYEMKEREPISVHLGDNSILYTLPPPSSGVLVAFSLNVLADYKFDPSFLDSCENTGLFFHRLIETMKFSFAKRSALGDIDFVNNTELLRNLTSETYSKWIMSLITDDKTHKVSYYHPSFETKEDHGTSHFSLVSPDGDAVSVTSTINYYFGSLIMGNKTGIVYNDEMDDFSSPNKSNIYNLPPSPSNFIMPYKRPMSSMSPIIIVDNEGNVDLVLGASGGSKILSATTQVSILSKLLKKTIKEAIDIPRVHHQLIPDEVVAEMNFPDVLVESLRQKGHIVRKDPDYAVCQGIMKSLDSAYSWQCNADFRKMGLCDGF